MLMKSDDQWAICQSTICVSGRLVCSCNLGIFVLKCSSLDKMSRSVLRMSFCVEDEGEDNEGRTGRSHGACACCGKIMDSWNNNDCW